MASVLERIRRRPAPLKHMYVERPAYVVTEAELWELIKQTSELAANAFQRGVEEGKRRSIPHTIKGK